MIVYDPRREPVRPAIRARVAGVHPGVALKRSMRTRCVRCAVAEKPRCKSSGADQVRERSTACRPVKSR